MKHTVSLKYNHVFQRLYRKGSSAVCPTMAVYAKRNGFQKSRLGLTLGTKVGKAVVRNRTRRRIREAYRTNEHRFLPGYDVVVVARVRAAHTPYALLERDLLRLGEKLGILREEEKG